MLYTKIAPYLEQSPFFQNLLPLKTDSQIYHLSQSARTLVASYIWAKTGKNIILVSQDDIIAEDLWDDLVSMVGKDNAFYLPDYEILPYEERSPHYSIRATRMITLMNNISSSIPAIYSLSIRSFLRLIPSRTSLSRHIFKLQKGDSINPDELLLRLQNMGYEIEYQVSTVYTAAKRGGILDLFSPPALHPVRIEFWGDEIMSIRSFSANTQRSISQDLSEITVIPARELSLDDVDSGSVIIAKIREKGFFEGIENYYSLLTKDLCPFADYFEADQRIFLFSNFSYITEEIGALTEQTHNQYRKELKQGSKGKIPKVKDLILSEEAFYKCKSQSESLYLSQSEFILPGIKENIRAPFSGQPAFEGDLGLLSESLIKKSQQGWQHYLLFDNPSQEKRMRQMLDVNVHYHSHIGVLHEGFELEDTKLGVFTDHEIFNRYRRKRYAPRFAPGETIIDYENLKPGDYVVHVDHGIGIFEGLKIIKLDGQEVECLVLRYANDDRVYVPTFQLSLVSKYVAEEGSAPALNKLGGAKWQHTKHKATQQIELIAADLVRLYAERSSRPGLAHAQDSAWQKELEESFIYEDTPDQARAGREIKDDMELPSPMERLLCGDVGFGKTEVAIRAAFKAVNSGYQVAVLAPTTLLTEQHYRVFKERLAQYPVRIAMLSRFRSKAMITRDVQDIASGRVDIAIGTHRLLSKDIKFPKLGLLIIDEEHRFGVRHKDRLRRIQSNVDTLYMSATPIPRTLNMALAKLKEISLMQTSPKERLPIRTIITPRDMEVIKDAIRREVDRGGQVFFVHNRVQTIETVATELRREMPDISFMVGHAQMSEHHLEEVMKAFVDREFQVLISTTIIENGIDIPNANTILIDRADTFGLAQIYQMRGRVGRSNRRAYAYLLIPKGTTEVARQRLEALTQYDFLGAGFQVALRDLELRGAGTILGTKQSGIIQAIGFNYYNRLLGRAIECVENGDTSALYAEDNPSTRQSIKTEVDLYFPPAYIDDDQERLRTYRRLSQLNSMADIEDFAEELRDRFGELPENARWLLLYFKVDLLAKQLKLKNCMVRHGIMTIEYDSANTPPKAEILRFSSRISEPLRFDAAHSLKIIIELDKELDNLAQFGRAVEILELGT
ncbi:MAG: transcription-repair coupling factor [Candidatus Cloacimonetes bacterium]|jgi:transcription-repair coupling factor (superfamily II helicase)|nr:transcription-repair coupling factor [Candidatus Cloacimonadota bacterium]MDD2506069.1 transcription-repair coupling factor [Candidatus Cloacimonadota bacterium]MDD4559652.1 transcription-repair coupling factor [Candidatus Cloacimonadota bacterium]